MRSVCRDQTSFLKKYMSYESDISVLVLFKANHN